jgi:hypothetical protein
MDFSEIDGLSEPEKKSLIMYFSVYIMQKMCWSPKAIDLLSGNNIYLKNLSSCYQMSLGDKLQKKKQICM